jgi:SAM-dependent methyltransferase
MRKNALSLLACPGCGGELSLAARVEASDGHVMEGEITCAGCKAQFPVAGGVPRLIPNRVDESARTTASRFGKEWKTFAHLADYYERWLRAWLDPLAPEDFRGKTVFEGGCGKGRHTVIIAGWGVKDIVALDLGEAVDVAFEHCRALPNAHVVQGDLLQPPVKRAFDIGFSIGVLHHLPDPQAGFDAVCRVVKIGGKVAIWVYGYESNEWIVRYVNPIREKITARIPNDLLYWLSVPPSAALFSTIRLYKQLEVGERLPYGDYFAELASLPFREIHSVVYDQLVTPLAAYLTEEEVRRWFDREGIADFQLHWHRRYSWRANATVTA